MSDGQSFYSSLPRRACILGRLCSIYFFLWGAIRGPWHHKTWSTLKGRGGSVASGTLAETPAVVVWCGGVGGLEASDVWEKLEGRGTHKHSDNPVEKLLENSNYYYYFFFTVSWMWFTAPWVVSLRYKKEIPLALNKTKHIFLWWKTCLASKRAGWLGFLSPPKKLREMPKSHSGTQSN